MRDEVFRISTRKVESDLYLRETRERLLVVWCLGANGSGQTKSNGCDGSCGPSSGTDEPAHDHPPSKVKQTLAILQPNAPISKLDARHAPVPNHRPGLLMLLGYPVMQTAVGGLAANVTLVRNNADLAARIAGALHSADAG
jgi:hypothetical protein